MKILHTADWHLGKKLDRFSRLEEQAKVLEEIVDLAEQHQVDMVIVAGDLFDSFNPGTEAVELFYKTLKALSKGGKRPVIAIAGNHDSPNLVDAPDPLARECGIILIGHPNAVVQPFQLQDFEISKSAAGFLELRLQKIPFPVRVLHTPYANEMRLKQYFGEDKEDELNAVLAENWQLLAEEFCDETGVNILTTHLYMNKKGTPVLDEPEGEKPLKIGNSDLIYSDAVPPQIQYTALGHLHGYKNIGTPEKPVVYSSSPLCYSFAEAGQQKYVSLINAEPGKSVFHEKIPLKMGKPLHRKTFSSVDEAVIWLQENQNALVELTLESDTFLTADERRRLYQSHSGIVYLIPKVKNIDHEQVGATDINLSQEMSELFKDYFKAKNAGQEPNADLLDLFKEVEGL